MARKQGVDPMSAILVGIVLLILGCIEFAETAHNLESCVSSTTGTVTYVSTSHRSRGGTDDKATVSYNVNNIEYSISISTTNHRFSKGDMIKIKYNPDSPSDSYCPDYPSASHPFFFLILSVVMLVIGIGSAVKLRS